VSYFVIRTAESWTWGGFIAGLLLLGVIVGMVTAFFFVTRDR
jgi:hypothetical protein